MAGVFRFPNFFRARSVSGQSSGAASSCGSAAVRENGAGLLSGGGTSRVVVLPKAKSLSRGDAPGNVEGGFWPKKGAVNAGPESNAASSMIRRHRIDNVSYVTRRRSTSHLCYLCASVFTKRVCVSRRDGC